LVQTLKPFIDHCRAHCARGICLRLVESSRFFSNGDQFCNSLDRSVRCVFPSLGVNELPAEVLNIVGERKVFFSEIRRQPMLPIIKRRSMELVFNLTEVAQHCDETPLVFSMREQSERLNSNAAALNVKLLELYSYKAIIAVEKLVSSAVRSSAAMKWQLAIKSRSLEPSKQR
jgi:hypothetical protein